MAVNRYRVEVNGQVYDVALDSRSDKILATIGDKTWTVDLQQSSDTNLVSLLLDNRSLELLINCQRENYTVVHDTNLYHAVVKPAWATITRRSESGSGDVTIESPLVGVVVDVRAAPGQAVQKGDVLLVIEAMKMQNELRAPKAGTIKSVRVHSGQKVSAKQPLAVLG